MGGIHPVPRSASDYLGLVGTTRHTLVGLHGAGDRQVAAVRYGTYLITLWYLGCLIVGSGSELEERVCSEDTHIGQHNGWPHRVFIDFGEISVILNEI